MEQDQEILHRAGQGVGLRDIGSPLNASYAEFFRFMLQFLCLQMCAYGGRVVPQGVVGDCLPWGGERQGGGGGTIKWGPQLTLMVSQPQAQFVLNASNNTHVHVCCSSNSTPCKDVVRHNILSAGNLQPPRKGDKRATTGFHMPAMPPRGSHGLLERR